MQLYRAADVASGRGIGFIDDSRDVRAKVPVSTENIPACDTVVIYAVRVSLGPEDSPRERVATANRAPGGAIAATEGGAFFNHKALDSDVERNRSVILNVDLPFATGIGEEPARIEAELIGFRVVVRISEDEVRAVQDAAALRLRLSAVEVEVRVRPQGDVVSAAGGAETDAAEGLATAGLTIRTIGLPAPLPLFEANVPSPSVPPSSQAWKDQSASRVPVSIVVSRTRSSYQRV